MSGPEFHETRMGRVFFEVTLPRLVEQLERLNENLERIGELVRQVATPSSSERPPDEHDRQRPTQLH